MAYQTKETDFPEFLLDIGDITCDINGSIQSTVKATNSENPLYVYNPISGEETDGVAGEGILVLAVDKLPSELPKEATKYFGDSLLPLIPQMAQADFTKDFNDLNLHLSIKKAIIAHRGSLTTEYKYLSDFIKHKPQG